LGKGETQVATSEEILQQILSLPVETRARLAQQLLESLEPQRERNRQLWDKEVESRLDAYERGELQAVSGEEVFARLREKFPESSTESKESSEEIIAAMRDAMNDELFLSDLWETMEDFEHADHEVEAR